MIQIGMEFSTAKSIIGKGTAEFAGSMVRNGVNLTPLPLTQFDRCLND